MADLMIMIPHFLFVEEINKKKKKKEKLKKVKKITEIGK